MLYKEFSTNPIDIQKNKIKALNAQCNSMKNKETVKALKNEIAAAEKYLQELEGSENISGKTYKLRLGAQQCVEVEKQLGKSVLSVLTDMAPDKIEDPQDVKESEEKKETISLKGMSLPPVEDIVIILHGALQKFQHEITLEGTYDIYDEYIDAGGSYMDFFDILQGLLEVSGFLPRTATVEEKAITKSKV